jgi:glucose/arabinose dehydrogenase
MTRHQPRRFALATLALIGLSAIQPGVANAEASFRMPAELPGAPAAAFDPTNVLRLSLSRVAGGLASPLFVTGAGDRSGRLFIVEQGGRIRVLSGRTLVSAPFLDISRKVSSGGERGLLGLAFHPSYRTNGRFFVNYTDRNGNTVIEEYRRSSTNSNRAGTAGRVLLRVTQPYANHNGGMIAFGGDGYLYVGMGDGGSAGDPGNRAQSLSSPLGKLLRIDVDHTSSGHAYAIPPGNPYLGRAGLDEIWASGLRNPWRFSFDRTTGDLWIGDVGQDAWEEIDRSTRASGGGRGLNYGWRTWEGRACFDPSGGCPRPGMTMPLAVYSHDLGCSVTGGYVYRGTQYPALYGGYVFADYCSGRIWALNAAGPSGQSPRLLLSSGKSISSFGQGDDGALYVTDIASGEVFKLGASVR